MRQATSITALGVGQKPNEVAAVTFGTEQVKLIWIEASNRWISRPSVAFEFRDLDPMAHNDDPVDTGQWRYFVKPLSSGLFAYGWNPTAILGASDAYAAGLRLQENLASTWWSWSAGALHQMAVVYYGFNDAEDIGPAISPDDTSPGRNVGTPLDSLATLRRYHSTGWVDCPIDTPTKHSLAPHLYTRYVSGNASGNARAEYVLAQWRWAGTPS